MRALALFLLVVAGNVLAAIDPALLARLKGDNDEKVAAIAAIVATGDAAALPLLEQMAAGSLKVDGEEVVLNNRIRREVDAAMAALRLLSPDLAAREAAVKQLSGGAD